MADATEVTPSGVRPPRGLTATPQRKAGNSSKTCTSLHGSPTPNGLVKPPATAGISSKLPQAVHDSEEGPLVLPRPHGPPHRRFTEAHILPCSSPPEEEDGHRRAGHSLDGDVTNLPNIDMPTVCMTITQTGAKAPEIAEGPAQQAVKPGNSKR